MTQFYQHSVKSKVRVDEVKYAKGLIDNRLWPTTVNTPPSGYYYVNEKTGLFVFSAHDWAAGLTISYVDLELTGPSKHKTITVGGEHVRRDQA